MTVSDGTAVRLGMPAPHIDLPAYLSRIVYQGDLNPDSATLDALHLAHATHIPFENLDIFLGRPIRLDLDSLQAKLVHARRGGYCFEQNLLFAAVLEQIGFPVTRLSARVRWGSDALRPRTHMLLLVEADGSPWLADVGFGAIGLLNPLPMRAGLVCDQFGALVRLVEEPAQLVLQTLADGTWKDMYAFTLEPHFPIDYEPANYYVSTHSDSRFVQTLTVQLPAPGRRLTLANRELTETRGDSVTTRTLADDSELLSVLSEFFGLTFRPGTHFRSPVAAESDNDRASGDVPKPAAR